MKNFKFFAAFFTIVSLLGLTGCSDDQAELLNGGQGPAGSIILNVNYTIPGQNTKVFNATYVTATANDTDIVINAENEDTGESMVISFTGNKEQTEADPAYVATITYIDANGNEYDALSPFTSLQTGAVKLLDINTADKTITGVFSLIGYDGSEEVPADGVPFFSGTFMNVPYTGTLPEPDPTENPNPNPSATYMKATIDGTVVNFTTASTITVGQLTTFQGVNSNPAYALQLTFADNSIIAEGNFPTNLEIGVNALFAVGEVVYSSVEDSGSIVITDITSGIATGTFSFTVENPDGETKTITAGEFKLPIQ
jgi:hypothetical protein